jgi:hypothetical protein
MNGIDLLDMERTRDELQQIPKDALVDYRSNQLLCEIRAKKILNHALQQHKNIILDEVFKSRLLPLEEMLYLRVLRALTEYKEGIATA